jgi:hydroxymethylbilane synthase
MPRLTDSASRSAIRVGTRGSALALWQTDYVCSILGAGGIPTERIEIRTTGDVVQDVPLSRIGTVAIFTRELDTAMLEGRIDAAVHSLKDLPTTLPDGIAVAAVSPRADPRDALVSRTGAGWRDLPPGAAVATSSLRRRAQLLAARPDLVPVEIRGNVDTRLRKLEQNAEWSGLILAAAGLDRLGLGERITERLPATLMLPAPGQGAIAVTVRADDDATASAVRGALHDHSVSLATSAERGFLQRLEGGCLAPIAALAQLDDDGVLQLQGRILSLDGSAVTEGTRTRAIGDDAAAAELGAELADELLSRGGAEILTVVRSAQP